MTNAERAPDPDAQMVMAVLMASPRRDEPDALLAAAKAYEALRSAREAGRIPPMDNNGRRPRATGLGSPRRAQESDR